MSTQSTVTVLHPSFANAQVRCSCSNCPPIVAAGQITNRELQEKIKAFGMETSACRLVTKVGGLKPFRFGTTEVANPFHLDPDLLNGRYRPQHGD